jgi:hypothetical protein
MRDGQWTAVAFALCAGAMALCLTLFPVMAGLRNTVDENVGFGIAVGFFLLMSALCYAIDRTDTLMEAVHTIGQDIAEPKKRQRRHIFAVDDDDML